MYINQNKNKSCPEERKSRFHKSRQFYRKSYLKITKYFSHNQKNTKTFSHNLKKLPDVKSIM